MKQYKDIPQSIQILIENYASSDPYGLNPSTLYNNIVFSLKSSEPQKVAEIFGISLSLCELIDNENKDI